MAGPSGAPRPFLLVSRLAGILLLLAGAHGALLPPARHPHRHIEAGAHGASVPPATHSGGYIYVPPAETQLAPGEFSRFVVFGMQRTSSSYLQRILNSHPDILCHPEVFIGHIRDRDLLMELKRLRPNKNITERTDIFLKYMWEHHHNASAVGFKIFPGQLNQDRVDMFLMQDLGLKKIVLYRRDLLEMVVSSQVAHTTHSYGSGVTQEMRGFSMDIDSAVKLAQKYVSHYTWLRQRLRSEVHYVLASEDVNQHSLQVVEGISKWLGVRSDVSEMDLAVESVPPRPPLSEIVSNLDELLEAFAENGIPTYFQYPPGYSNLQ